MPSEYELDRQAEYSEAYLHGRTLERLNSARLALAQIATGKVRNMIGARAAAKMGLELSAQKPEE